MCDPLYRLTQAISNTPGNSSNTKSTKGTSNAVQQQKEFFSYDPVGNRLTSANNRTYGYGPANQLLSNNGTGYRYDNSGNLIIKTTAEGTTTYAWDFENRLTTVTMPSGTVAAYRYDPFGRRIEKRVTENGITTTTRYLYDNEDILAEYDGQGIITNRYTHGPGIDEPFALTTAKESYYYHADGLGSIVAMTDASGKVVQTYEYDSFGNLKDLKNKIKQPYSYTGREYDRETNLYYYRARYYDAQVGRFISKDPISFAGGDVNMYVMVQNNIINMNDPSGLYRRDVHYNLTFMLAIKVGFSFKDAATISRANQGVDENILTSPFPIPLGVWLHFMSKTDANKYMNAALQSKDLKTCGKALHMIQDTYSHAGYNWYALGHVPDSAKGIDPDIFRPNHSRDIGMIAETLSYLYKMRDFSK